MSESPSIIGAVLQCAWQSWTQGDVARAQEMNAQAGSLMRAFHDQKNAPTPDLPAPCDTIVGQAASPMPPDDWEALWQRVAAQPPVIIDMPDMTPSDWDRVRSLLFTRPAPTTPPAGSRSPESASAVAPDPGVRKNEPGGCAHP